MRLKKLSMNKNYMVYPIKNMRITQTYLGNTSHLKHTTGNPKDFPIDDGGKDSGKEAIYCPCDEMKITAIKGYKNKSVTNTIWLVSTNKVITPTFEDICFMTLTHANDDDIKKLKVGTTFKRGEIICFEGKDGATANHIHIVVGRGYSSNWKKSSTNAWVIEGDTKKPEDIFFIDKNFTNVLYDGKLNFKYLKNTIGTPVARDTTKEQIEILVDNLNARTKTTTTSSSLGYVKKGIYNILERKVINNKEWLKIEDFWICYNKNWLNYYPKEQNSIIENNTILKEEYKLVFECKKDGYYKIFLKENTKLYLKEQ